MEKMHGLGDTQRAWEFKNCWHWLEEITRAIAVKNGFYDVEVPIQQEILLMHTELSEAVEALRERNPQSEKTPEFSCLEEELADVVIRIMTTACEHNLRLPAAILAKVEYNSTRPRMHGGKAF